ncbi:hypothetical protein F441_06083 [Phytophthora nicotianae CJ01A1]|uniref:Heterogeneous nuclear ribonucleoprotein Q acidic domain-containing protein n=2 Tax=Phytophthora nicotianae TaxID=4792 RepID=W2JBB0_PHYNI|nr:hypothetical protein L915_05950 [Phytophthora nicotianae]ETL43674.1 hypothetical protein L916_05886 [Phytophthora nicotianae]ETP20161.1 hypothetical protein F441_06083 [Phytophthora nicotianae CJ01A1]
MEHDAPAANTATDTVVDAPNELVQEPDAPLVGTPVGTDVSTVQEEINTVQEMETDTDKQLDDNVSQQQVEAGDAARKEDDTADNGDLTAGEHQEQHDEVMADPTASDPVTASQQEDETSEEKDTVNNDAANITTQEVNMTEASIANDEATSGACQEEASAAQDSADATANAAGNEEQEAGKDSSVMSVGDNSASSPPTHDESEYDPSAPSLIVDPVPHGEDEYDPANPSPAGTPVASNAPGFTHRPSTEQEEYDPDHPSMTPAAEEPVAMEVDHTSSNPTASEQSTMIPAKRKASDEPHVSDISGSGDTDPKRPRHVDDNTSSSHDDHKHGRPRRGSSDSVSSSSSRHKHHEEDHKGLSAAAWDRLMDFQTSGEFRVTQVSRAAFASVGAMPEFAQIAIIARFVRTPMKDVRDKNGQLMRIYREYQKENPQIAALQPVHAFMSDYKSDPGLFRFGYAPPQPATGMSNVQVPYQRDPVQEEKNSPRPERTPTSRSESERHHKDVDEFGRAVHPDKPGVPETNGSSRTRQMPAADPRLASRSRPGPSSPTPAMPRAASGPRAEDPRRRDQPAPQSSSAGRDPRRRSVLTNQPSPRGNQPSAPHAAASNNLYERLPPPVKAVVDSMRREGRLQEPLNDNVITRLLHLPEPVALQAVENFSNVDLSQVENLQGFLVGIINRVNEKAIASEKHHRPQVPSPRGQAPSAMSRGYGAQDGSVLGGPPQGGRLNNTGANTGGYRGQPAPMNAGPGPALYERPYEAPPDPRDPRRRQPAPQGPPQYGGAVRGPPQVGGRAPIGMQSFTALPMSVQNHVHSLVANRTLSSLEELGGKCYEVLGQLSEPLANQVLTRFAGANLSNVRNKSGFLIGVVKRARQEYGFN